MREDVFLSVVVPIYNEERRAGAGLGRMLEHLRAQPYRWELIAVEDGSSDRTKETALAAFSGVATARLISFPTNRGKGFAVREGIAASRGRYVLFLDVDLSVPIEAAAQALDLLQEGWQAVIGSRVHPESKILRAQPFWRKWGTDLFNLLRGGLIPSGFRDSQCGFKAFQGDLAREIFSQARVDGFMFDVEVLQLLERRGARVRELPVAWRHVEDSKLRVFRHTIVMFQDLLRIRRSARGRP